jgi:hypothetical protein
VTRKLLLFVVLALGGCADSYFPHERPWDVGPYGIYYGGWGSFPNRNAWAARDRVSHEAKVGLAEVRADRRHNNTESRFEAQQIGREEHIEQKRARNAQRWDQKLERKVARDDRKVQQLQAKEQRRAF